MNEIEVKVRWTGDAESALAFLETRGYRATGPRLHEADQLFDRESGQLQSRGQILRLRITGKQATVTYKGPVQPGPYKIREEIEYDVSDPVAFELVLERLGYQRTFRYEKFRTKFARREGRAIGDDPTRPPGVVTLDETPIGIFMELEGPEYWIDATANDLGFPRDKFLTAGYPTLYSKHREAHREAPHDMIFLHNQFAKH